MPLAVIRRQARPSELSRVVPECCGLVWEAVRAQQAKGGRHVAIYWDGSIRLEVGVELSGPFTAHGDVVRSATACWCGRVGHASGTLRRPRRRARGRSPLVSGQQSPSGGAELGDLRSLAGRVERQSVANPHGRLLPRQPYERYAVSTSRRPAVIATVCSSWTASVRLCVRIVHPSAASTTRAGWR